MPHRLVFDELPLHVRRALEAQLGSPVVDAANRDGGYSPSLASACRLADGRRVFVKAVSPSQNPDTPRMLRNEARVTAALPPTAPAPALLHVLDDGEWVVAVYRYVDGRLPVLPWSDAELSEVLEATWALSDVGVPARLPGVAEMHGESFVGWRNLVADPPLDGLPGGWSAAEVSRLAAMEPAWEDAVAGNTLVHGDVRSDNVLLGEDGVTFVDWSSACVGCTFFDVACMLPSVSLEGGGAPEVLWRRHAPPVDADAVTALVVAITAYFLDRARRPDPPGLPTVRAFQRAQGEVCVAWLSERLGWA
jgi:hypothetical protein